MNAKLVSSSSSRRQISCLLAVAHVSYSTGYGFLARLVVLIYSTAVRFKTLIGLVGLGFIRVGLGVNLGCC